MTKNTDTPALQRAKSTWAAASAAQIEAVKATQTARDDLARVQALIAEEQGRSDAAALAGRNAILAELGFAKKTDGATASAAAIAQATAAQRLDALQAAQGMAEEAVARADSDLVRCDAATRRAERGILEAKADAAKEQEIAAFAVFQKVHLAMLASAHAAGRSEHLHIHTFPARMYGERHQFEVPGLEAATAALVAQAEAGE